METERKQPTHPPRAKPINNLTHIEQLVCLGKKIRERERESYVISSSFCDFNEWIHIFLQVSAIFAWLINLPPLSQQQQQQM